MGDEGETQDPPHGFGDDAVSRLLRRRPAPEAIAWVEQSLGCKVLRWQARRGGSSSAIHALRIERDDVFETVILRRYVRQTVTDEEPDIVEREVRSLAFVTAAAVLTPRTLEVDVDGSASGLPSLLMSCLPGRVEWFPAELDDWLRKLARVPEAWHSLPPPTPAEGIIDFRPYAPESWDPPAWLRDQRLWDRAVAAFHGPVLDDERVFLARDYHPGNVLWRRGRVTGAVDWQAACVGPPSVDVSWCRGNILGRFGLEIADRFVRIWESETGRRYHPWAEAAMAVDVMGWSGPRSDREARDLETTTARALAALGL